MQEVPAKKGRPKKPKPKNWREYRDGVVVPRKKKVCVVCFLQSQDRYITKIINDPVKRFGTKAREITERYPEWRVTPTAIKKHLEDSHVSKRMLGEKKVDVYTRDEIYAALKEKGVQQLMNTKESIPPKMLLDIIKSEREDKKLEIEQQQFDKKMGLGLGMLQAAMYGSGRKEELSPGKEIIEGNAEDK